MSYFTFSKQQIAKLQKSHLKYWCSRKSSNEKPCNNLTMANQDEIFCVKRVLMTAIGRPMRLNICSISRKKREYAIPTKIRKPRPYNIEIKKDLTHRVAPNILKQQFAIKEPDKVYCTDITYLFYRGGVGYLSATKDIATTAFASFKSSAISIFVGA